MKCACKNEIIAIKTQKNIIYTRHRYCRYCFTNAYCKRIQYISNNIYQNNKLYYFTQRR